VARKRQYDKCPECDWYISKTLLDEEHYDGVCPICDYDFNEGTDNGTGG
jgi:uncharacterized paraquat-inducible protein A